MSAATQQKLKKKKNAKRELLQRNDSKGLNQLVRMEY